MKKIVERGKILEENKRKRTLKAFGIVGKIITVLFAIIGVIAVVFLVSLSRYSSEISEIMFTYNTVINRFYEPVESEQVLEGVPSGIVSSLDDPYSKYFNKEKFGKFVNQISGSYGGVGILLGQSETGYVEALKIYPNTPAEKAGVLEGDLLLRVGDLEGEGKKLDEISGVLKGAPNTEVAVTVYRPSENKEINLSITRETISLPSVYGGFLKSEPDTLYIEISSFVENTSNEVETLINGLDKKPKKVILDLRGNSGGLVGQAIKIASYFVPEGVVMFEFGRDTDQLETFSVCGTNFLDVPTAVLIDSNTASSSEILAGAIQDRQSGTLIGETTYGKAVVQTVIPTPVGGGIRLTTKRYLTPNKRDINKTGLTPDIELIMISEDLMKIDRINLPDENNDLVLKRALSYFNEK